ncbi:MAG: transposase, partial [Paludibacteraceae bacterium]|nr:transposase [Paludibacteraceae bacterium]
PSYIPKSGKHTAFLDYYWSGAAGQAKWGLEILAIALIGIDTHDCISLYAQQTPDNITLERYDSNLVDWYAKIVETYCKQMLKLSRYLVAEAFFAIKPFVDRMLHVWI